MTENNADATNLNIDEVAKKLRVSRATVLRWVKAQKLTGFFRIGRKWLIRKDDLERFINFKVNEENK